MKPKIETELKEEIERLKKELYNCNSSHEDFFEQGRQEAQKDEIKFLEKVKKESLIKVNKEKIKSEVLKEMGIEPKKNIAIEHAITLAQEKMQKLFEEKIEVVEMKLEPRLDEFFDKEIQRQEARTFIKEFIQELLTSIQNNSQHNTLITTKEGETKRGKIVEGLPENHFNNNTLDADTSISGAGK